MVSNRHASAMAALVKYACITTQRIHSGTICDGQLLIWQCKRVECTRIKPHCTALLGKMEQESLEKNHAGQGRHS
ncbi:hypothetical protein M3J09_004709 [Ascochyta lentis]